jgi:glucose/mannose-6-phosphate isomerase
VDHRLPAGTVDLDDLDEIQRVDRSRFLLAVERISEHILDACARASAVEALPAAEGLRSMAILGMGGSALAGDVCRALLADSPLFIRTVRGYACPPWVGADTLVFAVSHSGDTDETLHAMTTALARGARVIAVSRGGACAALARERGLPLVEIPRGFRASTAVAYLIVPLLVLCERLGLCSLGPAVVETVQMLRDRLAELGASSPVARNSAKQLASRLLDRLPVVYGSEGLSSVAAYRWKCQFNETAKVPAFSHVFPELTHNEVEGWGAWREITPNAETLILRDPSEHPHLRRKVDAAISLLSTSGHAVHEIHPRGSSPLARLFDLISFGDFVSTYLALLRGEDPMPVDVVKSFKRVVADSGVAS